jgi:hypothetical protein
LIKPREILKLIVLDRGPPPLPVRFRTVAMEDHAVTVKLVRKRGAPDHFLICLRRPECETCLVDTVIHELAHVYAWVEPTEFKDDHDARFGIEWAANFQAYYGTH